MKWAVTVTPLAGSRDEVHSRPGLAVAAPLPAAAAELPAGTSLRFADGTESAITRHGWPGNLSELRNRVERAAALSDDSDVRAKHLGLASESTQALAPLADAVEEFRRQYVKSALERFGGNRTQAAWALGVDVRTVFRLLEKEHGTDS